ncbi:MAG TPA: VacJ family lipoprotein [Steroidobacteraceae bacterium]|nr:VacJ family lipoprotein [Steroidobacteraceae bacterium]
MRRVIAGTKRARRTWLERAARLLLIGVAGAALGGCTTAEFSMRSLPPETPAAEHASAVRNAEAMEAAAKQAAAGQRPTPPAAQPAQAGAGPEQGAAPMPTPGPPAAAASPSQGAGASAGAMPAAPDAASTQPAPTAEAPTSDAATADAEPPIVPLTTADAPSMYTYDPWERFNRFSYRFNARFDEAIFLPVSNGYRRVPSPIRAGVHNFFSNLSEIDSFGNYILQARFLGSVKSLGRFVINSTIGIGGLFDVATRMKLPNPPTGFSETLSTWGAHPGPYLVVPILGPSTLRDGVGYLGDYGLDYGVNPFNLYQGYASYALGTLNAIDTRSNIGFRYYATGSPFEYEVIRFLYVRKRLIEDEALHGRGKPKPRDVDAPAGR